MEINRSKAPVVRMGPDDNVLVTLSLTGDDPPEWKTVFNAAARAALLRARSVNDLRPWSIVLTLAASTSEQEVLRILGDCRQLVDRANQTTPRRPTPAAVDMYVQSWWKGLP
jgi:hypothetical protein